VIVSALTWTLRHLADALWRRGRVRMALRLLDWSYRLEAWVGRGGL